MQYRWTFIVVKDLLIIVRRLSTASREIKNFAWSTKFGKVYSLLAQKETLA